MIQAVWLFIVIILLLQFTLDQVALAFGAIVLA